MRNLKSNQNIVEFSAKRADEPGGVVTHVRLFIDSNGSEARLSVDAENYTLTCLKKGVEPYGSKHFLQGMAGNSHDIPVTLIIDCGVEPPEFRIMFQKSFFKTEVDGVYYIDHTIQDNLNDLLDKCEIPVLPLSEERCDRTIA